MKLDTIKQAYEQHGYHDLRTGSATQPTRIWVHITVEGRTYTAWFCPDNLAKYDLWIDKGKLSDLNEEERGIYNTLHNLTYKIALHEIGLVRVPAMI